MLYTFEVLKIKSGIAFIVIILVLFGILLAYIPNNVWYPTVQMIFISGILYAMVPVFEKYDVLSVLTDNQPISIILCAAAIVLCINFFQSLFGVENFYGASAASGATPFKDPNPFCPPTLNFDTDIDTDTERQMPACFADENSLTEEQKMDEIDIYIRDAEQSISQIFTYLKSAQPNEQWESKQIMDDPMNRNIVNQKGI